MATGKEDAAQIKQQYAGKATKTTAAPAGAVSNGTHAVANGVNLF